MPAPPMTHQEATWSPGRPPARWSGPCWGMWSSIDAALWFFCGSPEPGGRVWGGVQIGAEEIEGRCMREYSPGHPLVFCHIPKSAGTSLTAALIEALQPSRPVVGVDLTLLGGYELDGLSAIVRAGIIARPEDLPQDASLVAGHISPGTTMARFPDADHITTLRNPRSRVASQWIHSRAMSEWDLRHWGTVGTAFRLGWLPFADYLQQDIIAPNVDNTITRFLAWPHPLLQRSAFIEERHDDELLAVARGRLEHFANVGVVENPLFLAELGAWLGRELPDMRQNERTFIPRKRRPDLDVELSASTVDLLDHRTRLDQQVWADVVRRSLDEDPQDILRSSWEKSISRYADAMDQPAESRPLTPRGVVRPAVVALYELKARIGSRS
jgi:hypothetical protein